MTPISMISRRNFAARDRRIAFRLFPGSIVSHHTIGLAVGMIEAFVITLGSAVGQIIYGRAAGIGHGELDAALGLGILSSALYVSMARSAGLYRLPVLIEPASHLRRIATVCVVALLALTAVLFLLKISSEFSRGALLGFAAIMLLTCGIARIAAAAIVEALLSHDAVAGRAAYLIGEDDELAHLTPSYLLRQFGLREVGRLALDADRPADWSQDIQGALLGARHMRAREIVVATRLDSLDNLDAIKASLRVSPLAVRLIPNKALRSLIEDQGGPVEIRDHLIELQRKPMGITEQLVKRLVDIVVAGVALLLLSPIFLMTALAIKFDSSGPVIFRQRRNGFDQTPFTIYKFRSMTVMEDGGSVVQARKGDRRVTRVGALLRKTSIDELPQLMNVLLGDMSVVGPRPHALAHDDAYKLVIGDYCMRHHVKPGITGWAQVNGCRGETVRTELMQKRVDLDLWYVNNRSTFIDLKILMRTCFEVFGHEAY